MNKKDRIRFWRKLFRIFKVGDRVRVIRIWDEPLRRYEPDLIGKEGVILKRDQNYHRCGESKLYHSRHADVTIPIVAWEICFKGGGTWHLVDEDLELLTDE